jgi:filamentous hemagglutinin family protein
MRWIFLFFASVLCSNPQGATPYAGDVQTSRTGSTLEVVATDRAVIDWNSFSIGAGEITRFIQPSSHAAVLNRVIGKEVSQINGRLEANGIVYLLNPNGVLIGKQGQISAAEFFGSSLHLNPDDFIEGTISFLPTSEMGKITHLGKIETTEGSVSLIAYQIENKGIIEPKNGILNLGSEILLDPSGDQLLLIRPNLEIEALKEQLKKLSPYAIAAGFDGSEDASMLVRESGEFYLVPPLGSTANSIALVQFSTNASQTQVYVVSGDISVPAPPPPPPPPPAPIIQVVTVATTQSISQTQLQQATTSGSQQPTATPDTKKGCRSPSVAIQAN